jgi:hypothetical protein
MFDQLQFGNIYDEVSDILGDLLEDSQFMDDAEECREYEASWESARN